MIVPKEMDSHENETNNYYHMTRKQQLKSLNESLDLLCEVQSKTEFDDEELEKAIQSLEKWRAENFKEHVDWDLVAEHI